LARKILLADDSVTAQNMGRKILADAGYEVHTVNNGSAALKKIAELKPDLVVLDVYMPGYSGLEVCQRLKESQDTARTPVLLTVGKLEPFKPEEAKRVRAEGFIVKPFEASELLGALAKLEDKIVPRSESSKSKVGRFARANSALEESSRSSREEPTDENLGWKNRISFPSKKKELTAQEDDGNASAVHPVGNRDLHAAGHDQPAAESQAEIANPEESPVVVAALATPGVPIAVSPEEIAAIAAAASQVESAVALGKESLKEPSQDSRRSPEGNTAAEAKISDENIQASVEPVQLEPDQTHQRHADVIAAIAGLEPANGGSWARHGSPSGTEESSHGHSSDEHSFDRGSADEQAVAPATMAGSLAEENTSGDSRWVAIPVAPEATEAATSLDLEMQKAYAAFAAAEANLPGFVSSPPAMEPVDVTSQGASPSGTQASPDVAHHALKPDAELANTVGAIADATAEAVATPAERLADVAGSHSEAESSPVQAVGAVSAEERPVAETPTTQNENRTQEAVSGDSTKAEALNQNAPTAELAKDGQEIPTAPASVSAANVEEPRFAARPFSVVSVGITELAAEPNEGAQEKESVQKESESSANTAAAWANWREIRNSGSNGEEGEPATPTDSAAMAVAAGAERSPEHPSAAADEDPQALASIVDSVMAELRPKIMEEISRKMKKK
jgi:two-component system chemotaxis response regulator CheY